MSEVIYLDEYRRERWLLKLQVARETGEIAVFGAIQPKLADVIPFPVRAEVEPDGAA